VKEVGTGNLKEPREENPRRKKKKPTKKLPLQEMVSAETRGSSHDNRSQELHPKMEPKLKVGGGGG
jgi:hypothetical protein